MKNKSLSIILMVLAFLVMAGTNGWAQRGNRGGSGNSCYLNIPDLTEKQKTEITRLVKQHQEEMDALRNSWRQSAVFAEREAHWAEVDKNADAHRNAVRNLLNDEQKQAFDNVRRGAGRIGSGCMGNGRGRFAGANATGCRGGRFGRGWNRTNN